MTSTRPLASANPLEAVFKMYHEEPVMVLLTKEVDPSLRKNGVMGWFVSSTMLGSAASAKPEEAAGPSKPMVAYVSSAKSGNAGKNAGLMPDAFQLALKVLLNTPSGAETNNSALLLPNMALIRSPSSGKFT